MKNIVYSIKNIVFLTVKGIIGKWRYFLILSEKRGRGIKKIHYTDSPKGESVASACVFISNGMTQMGGLCDRLKGIISMYAWCKDHKKPFKIYFTSPFILEKYLVPNEYDWTIDINQISFCPDESEIVCILYTFDIADIVNSGEAVAKTQKYFDKRLSGRKACQIHIYSNAQTPDALDNFSGLFNQLFKPHDDLQHLMEYHLRNLGDKFISISFRFTTLLGDFHDCTGEPLSAEDSEEYIRECLYSIEKISAIAEPHEKILITADSMKFLGRVNIPGCYIIPGDIGHIQYDSGDNMIMKTFLDLMMISRAREVYLVKYKKMYNSGFARTAAMIGPKPFKVFDPSN